MISFGMHRFLRIVTSTLNMSLTKIDFLSVYCSEVKMINTLFQYFLNFSVLSPGMELGARPKTKYAVKSNDSNSEDDNEEEGSIENLPDEILEYIFSLISPYSDLDSCSQVCSRQSA